MSNILLDNVQSPQDLKELILDVRKYSKWYSQTSVKMQVTKNNQYEIPTISQPATDLINGWVAKNQLNQDSLDKLLNALEEFDAKAPRITITLAAPAPNSLKRTLIAWCRQNINPNILVNFNFNSTILGGMVVNYGSHVHDWSFRRRILASREKFPEVLRRV